MNAPKHNAFKTAEECAEWLDSISHIEGSFATSNGADWIRHLVKALPPSSPVADSPTWQPIDTAPKDGTNVLLGWPKMVLGGYWADWRGSKSWVTARGEYVGSYAPTHWMPLPSAPSPSAGAAKE